METEYEERMKKAEEKQLDVKKEGNADTLKLNPGAVTYDDLKKYLEQKNKSRFSSENS